MVRAEWGGKLIKGWNEAGWMEQPGRIGDMIGGLVGAPVGSIVMGDTLSIKVFQALAAGLQMRPERRVILSDRDNFPSDLYMAEGLVELLGTAYELRLVDPEDIATAVSDDVAVVMLTEVSYRNGRKYDMNDITKLAHQAGAVMLWDLAHSAGAIPVNLTESGAEFAVGCTYKYLNGGPGAPAFIYIRPDLIEDVQPALSGWLGHAAPFEFGLNYRPAKSIERMRVGTPPVIQLTALEAALEVWVDLDMEQVRAKSMVLSQLLISETEARCPDLKLISPRDPFARGSQVAFVFEHGFAAMRALTDHGVIGDFRAPNVMRFGITPLYLDEEDIISAVKTLEMVLTKKLWQDPKYQSKTRVT
jgi:kynureninase